MKLFQYKKGDSVRLGVRLAEFAIDVQVAVEDTTLPADLFGVLHDPSGFQRLADYLITAHIDESWHVDESKVAYAPCVAQPEKIICVGMNYRRHVEETNGQVPDVPVLFSKFANTLAASGDSVTIPPNMHEADYEVELGVVIGREARNVPVERALDYVFGYCTINDLSARDWQMRTSQWLLGKTPDAFMPIGPYLVTADEIGDPQNLRLKTWVNGELRQNSNTADMIFSVAQIINYISEYFTLRPGDVISTGTPEGVILGMNPKYWLKPGDEVIVEVEHLGQCITRFR